MQTQIPTLRWHVEALLRAAGLPEQCYPARLEGVDALEDEAAVWLVFYGDFDEDDPSAVAGWHRREAAYYRRAVEALRSAGLDAAVESSPTAINWIEVSP